ncbi:putative membrane protein (TIGR02234 family) [Halopolyspora algeriensis]|uniref:Putative membrane protein (TIGR02234 family) n=1 Tax=Halopolyspora algeriensis TaxID=1500506 RepID=A0A368VQB0_9ACTN|nr:Trp biosynthesis-associated membrane protein [Halopolyspora algeriensis]RCW43215.1 putative membrane protein (TIGR02234 family) [Halopolyspora algeriensis]TQM56274.1 putative membrane protein (TIGR02234 family) [Halopolyspora algeriensis]
MTDERESEAPRPPNPRRLLSVVVLLMLAAAAALWGASALTWGSQRYSTRFSGEKTAAVSGAMVRPELVPLALATLAGVAALLATGGWLRRIIGLLMMAEAGLLGWRVAEWATGPPPLAAAAELPPGSTPVDVVSTNPAGALLTTLGAVLLLAAGLLIVVRARSMPAMGAKYSAPATAKRESRDPDRRLWEALDAGEDPTDPPGDGDRHS